MTHPSHVDVATYAEADGSTPRRVRYRIERGEIQATQAGKGSPWLIPWSEYRKVAPEETPKAKLKRDGRIRGFWTSIFGVAGQALGFLLMALVENYTSLPSPWGLWGGIIIGALASGVGYGFKKRYKPTTDWPFKTFEAESEET